MVVTLCSLSGMPAMSKDESTIAKEYVQVSTDDPARVSVIADVGSDAQPGEGSIQKQLFGESLQTKFRDESQSTAIMLAMQRSGTNFLSAELNRHPCISMQPELFVHGSWTPELQKQTVEIFLSMNVSAAQLQRFPNTTQEVLKNSAQAFRSGAVVRGFNWKLNQDFVPCWKTWLADVVAKHDVRLIWVQRLNILRRIFSNYANKKTKTAVTKNEDLAKALGSVRVAINASTILQELAKEEEKIMVMKKILSAARRQGVQVQTVHYENMTASLDAIKKFLLRNSSCSVEVKASLKRYPSYRKIHTGKLKDLVENWPQVRSKLRRTSWEWMLST